MAEGEGQAVPASRRAMLATWAALRPEIRTGLSAVGLTFTDDELDPHERLKDCALHRGDSPAEVPRLQLARAAMEVLHPRRPQRDDAQAVLEPVLAELLPHERRSGAARQESLDAVHQALRKVTPIESEGDRWSALVDRAGPHLHPHLSGIEKPVGTSQLRLVDGDEYAARVEARFEVLDPDNVGLDKIAPRVLPQRWPEFNHFFCSMERGTEDRDRDQPGPNGLSVEPTANARSWRHVFLEKVGACPGGWFPDTFLLFTWARSETQLILYYELAKRRPKDKTQLKIDEGYIQVDQLPGRYVVTTLKTLLFDDKVVPSGGQFLAKYAFELGWLDQAINWFSIDAPAEEPAPLNAPSSGSMGPTGMDAGVQAVLNRCEADVQAAMAEVDAQCSSALGKIRGGSYGLDTYVQDWARAAERTIRYGARSVDNQISFVKALKPPEFT